MGWFLKVIGFFLVIGGLYGLFVTIPDLLFNVAMDEINPLIILGIIESQTPTTMLDLLLSGVLVIIGIVFIKKHDPIPQIPK